MFFIRCFNISLPFAYMLFIWYLSSQPSDAVINTGLSFDATLKELLHLVEFAGLYGLWIIAFLSVGKLNYAASKLAAFLAIAYGFIDEIHQYFVPYRSATVIDLIKDTVGVIFIHFLLKKFYFQCSTCKIAAPIRWVEEKLKN